MNFHRPLPEAWTEVTGRSRPALASFARASVTAQERARFRVAGIVGVLSVHGLLVCAYYFLGSSFARVEPQQAVTVVNVLPEPEKPLPPPPLPKFAAPEAYVPTMLMPDIELVVPPPPRETITLAPPTTVIVPPGPPANSPAAPPAPSKPAMTAEGQAAFAKGLFAHLNRFKTYPPAARLRHEEGMVSLRVSMNRMGQVLSFSIAKSSGSRALDEEVLALIKRAQPLPVIPAEFSNERLDLVIPVEFSLR